MMLGTRKILLTLASAASAVVSLSGCSGSKSDAITPANASATGGATTAAASTGGSATAADSSGGATGGGSGSDTASSGATTGDTTSGTADASTGGATASNVSTGTAASSSSGAATTGTTRGTGGGRRDGGATSSGTNGASGTTGAGGTTGTSGSNGATATGVGAEGGTLVFVGDFETGNTSQWNYAGRCATDRILVYSTATAPAGAPAPRQGQYAVRFHVLDTDVSPCTSTENPRAELLTLESLFKPGDDLWQTWSMYLPTTNPAPLCTTNCSGPFFVFQEDYGPPFDGSPSIGWNLDYTTTPPHFRMDRGAQYNHDQPWIGTLTTGRWIDFLVHKKFANTADGGGFVEAWVDKMPITFSSCSCTKLATQTMHSTQPTLGFYLSAYRSKGLFASFDSYYDAVRVGTTRAIVELP